MLLMPSNTKQNCSIIHLFGRYQFWFCPGALSRTIYGWFVSSSLYPVIKLCCTLLVVKQLCTLLRNMSCNQFVQFRKAVSQRVLELQILCAYCCFHHVELCWIKKIKNWIADFFHFVLQKAMLLQQSSWQNNIRMSSLVEQVRCSLLLSLVVKWI